MVDIVVTAEEFQFHNGSIKSQDNTPIDDPELSFNSTMVRLKAEWENVEPIINDTFQFHNGSIKSPR